MSSAVIFQIQSTIIVGLFYVGVFLRKERSKHMKIMLTAITWDILLILQIELTRSAVGKAIKVVSNPMLLNIHVGMAVSTVVLYFILIFTGRKLSLGNEKLRQRHRFFGITCLVLRTLTYITSYFVVD